jgi:competence protein ComEC
MSEIVSKKGVVTEARQSYAIVKISNQNYYVSNYKLKLLLDQRIIISAKIEELSQNHYFGFQFKECLKEQRIFKQLSNVKLVDANWHYLRFYFFQKVFQGNTHDLTLLFIFNIKDKTEEFQKQMQNLNISHLLTFNSLFIWLV